MSFFSRIFRNRSARKKSKAQNYDYLPLFFWDKSLSNMAKIIMCLVCGGNANREKTMNKLRSVFNPNTVNSIEEAITQLEKYGYMSSESYLGPFTVRVSRSFQCLCHPTQPGDVLCPFRISSVLFSVFCQEHSFESRRSVSGKSGLAVGR